MGRWVGSAKLRVSVLGETLLMQAAGTSTSSGPLRRDLAALFRTKLKGRGPDYHSYEVSIWIEGLGPNDRIDVDNIAKSCLDALTGLLWRDDRQVVRLSVEKLIDTGPPRITLAATPTVPRGACERLQGWLNAVDRK